MTRRTLELGEEAGARKTFVWAVDWPGWCRSGRDRARAVGALLEHAPRYARVVGSAGLEPPIVDPEALRTVDSVKGGGGTDFGVPTEIVASDRRRVTAAEAARLAALVEAAWTELDRVAAAAPATLRKGPRGGGRDTARIVDHVIEADHAYAREVGLRLAAPDPTDRRQVTAAREAVLAVLRERSDGSPLAGRRWPPRYAARRIAWHALDHAWEIEDRTEPGG